MADHTTPDSIRSDQANVEYVSGRVDTYDGVSEIVLAEEEYIIRQGGGSIVMPHGNITKVTAGENIDVTREN